MAFLGLAPVHVASRRMTLRTLPEAANNYKCRMRSLCALRHSLWAMVSDEVAARLAEGTTKLRPQPA